MAITVDSTTNCRLIDWRALGTEAGLGEPVKVLLGLLGQRNGEGVSAQPLSQYQLSRLLWASHGWWAIPLSIAVYVAALDGLYRFDADTGFLRHVVRRDVRKFLAGAGSACSAPISLLYVADIDGGTELERKQQELTAAMCAGSCSQNVTLMCAAEGLVTDLRVIADPGALRNVMALRDSQRPLLAQAVGLPVRRMAR